MIIDNYRILKIDEFNFVYEKKYIKEKDGNSVEEWKRCKGYFNNITQCLDNIKNNIIGSYISESDDYEETIKKIDELNNKIINCKLTYKEE